MLVIGARAWRELRDDVFRRLPEEACGILLGRGDLVLQIYPCRNAHAGDRTRFYEIEPADQFACARHARAANVEWIGYYHSHPNGVTEFSRDDRTRAIPGSRHVIVAVRDGKIMPPRAWRRDPITPLGKK